MPSLDVSGIDPVREEQGRDAERPDDEVVLVEDVVTTAGSCIKGIHALREAGADVRWVISVIDREAGGAEALEAEGVKFIPLVKGSELLGER